MANVPSNQWILGGSARSAPAVVLGSAGSDERLSISVILRRRPDGPPYPDLKKLAMTAPLSRNLLSREEFAAGHGAAQSDIDRVVAFVREQGLTVEETSIARRTVLASGSVAQLNRVFAVQLMRYQSERGTYLSYAGQISMPNEFKDIVENVFGLDREPLFTNQFESPALPIPLPGPTIKTLTPPQVASLYQFPSGTGAGQTIGILEFGGGFNQSDINDYFKTILNVAAPAPVIFHSVNGGTNVTGVNKSGDLEQLVDICVASSVAPGATVVVYKPPDSSFQSWHECLSTAINDSINKPSVLTCSWFGHESAFIGNPIYLSKVTQDIQDAQMMGVTILFASGDTGNVAPPLMHYPSTDPGVIACGGTIVENVSGANFDQVGWSDSSGGVSAYFPKPSWQSVTTPATASGFNGRAIPDVAGNADKNSGYLIRQNGKTVGPYSGTSAVAPLYAALIAIINQNLNTRVGFLNYYLYASEAIYPQAFYDVVTGSNATYSCTAGWDAVTGLGSIYGNILQKILASPCWSLQAEVNDLLAEIQVLANSLNGEIPGNKNVLQEISELIGKLAAARQALATCRANNPV
jgi:kumamolisin